MELLFEAWFWRRAIRFFTFKRATENTTKIFYSNAIYHGEVRISPNGVTERHGVGFLFTAKGDFYYGAFENDQLHGEGNYFFNDGNFLRGTFQQGRLHGPCLYSKRGGDLYLFSFDNAILHGQTIFFPGGTSHGFVLLFKKGKFDKKLTHYEFEGEENSSAKSAVIDLAFKTEQSPHILLELRDVMNLMKRTPEETVFFGTFDNPTNSTLLSGFFTKKAKAHGLGVFLDFEDKLVKFGEFYNGLLHGKGVILNGNYLYAGSFVEGEMEGKMAINSLSSDKYKLCLFEADSFKKQISEGEKRYPDPLFEFSKREDLPKKEDDLWISNSNFVLLPIIIPLFSFDGEMDGATNSIQRLPTIDFPVRSRNEISFNTKKTQKTNVTVERPKSSAPPPRKPKSPRFKPASEVKTSGSPHRMRCWDFDRGVNDKWCAIKSSYFKNSGHMKSQSHL